MSQQERWDVVLAVLNGPQAALGEQVYRGPVVRIGGNPGPGGMQLVGYRGIDTRQCVITAYDGSTISVAPVGNNQVRMAPHTNVKWKEIDPIRGPTYLSKGCAIHVGPVGRGATIEFVECRKLGVWQAGALASAAAAVETSDPVRSDQAPPEAYDARSVGQVEASRAPFWFLGCSFLMTGGTAVALTLMGAFLALNREVEELGPVEQGYEFYASVDLDTTQVDDTLLEGLHRPFYDFVMAPNVIASGSAHPGLDNPDDWDPIFLAYVTASVEQHVRAWQFFSRIDAVRREYAQVTTALREAGLPEVFAAIPYTETRYRAGEQSEVCAKGYWQFMPETALQVERRSGMTFRVRDCRFQGSDIRWSPTELTPPPNVAKNGDYMDEGVCQITSCDVDDRTDLTRSTAAAVFSLNEAWNDPTLRGSGALVQLVIASHNTGYDDSRFGRRKITNVLHAYNRYVQRYGAEQGPLFYGSNIRCKSHLDVSTCGGQILGQTQHYVYKIVAQHLLAVCYYGLNYGEDRAFEPWASYSRSDGYCSAFEIPSRDEVLRNKAAK